MTDPRPVTAEQVQALQASVDGLTAEGNRVRDELRATRRAQRVHSIIAVLVIAVVVGAGVVVQIVNHRDIQANNQLWCPVIGVFVPGPGEPRPDTERGAHIVDEMTRLYRSLGCTAGTATPTDLEAP